MAAFEAKPAFGEFVQILEQLHRALEDAGEIQQRVRVERALVLAQRDREHAPDAAGHDGVEVAPERANRARHLRRDLRGRGAMAAPRVHAVAVGGREPGAGKTIAAGLSFLRQEISSNAVDEGAERVRVPVGLRDGRPPRQPAKVVGQHRELRVAARTVVQKPVDAVRHAGKHFAKPHRGRFARGRRRQVARPFLQEPAKRVRRHEPAVQQRRQPAAQAPFAELREHEGDILVVFRDGAADAQRLIERLARRGAAPPCRPRDRSRDRRRPRAGTRGGATGRTRRWSRSRCRRGAPSGRASAPRRTATGGSLPSAAR